MSCCAAKTLLRCGGAVLVFAFLVLSNLGRPARAETIEEALADAYLINPVLNAERARLRATDEEVALAKSGLRPFIFGTADTAFQNQQTTVGGQQQQQQQQGSPLNVLTTNAPGTCAAAAVTGTVTCSPASVVDVPVNQAFGQTAV